MASRPARAQAPIPPHRRSLTAATASSSGRSTHAGNGSQVVSRSFTVDTQPPKVRITDADRTTAAKTREEARATFILQASEHVGLRCRIDSRPFKPCSSPYRTPKLTPGTHRLKVKATDEAGNVGTKLKRFKIQRRRPRASTAASVPSHPRCHGIAATLIGTPHGDILRGTKGRDVIVGFAGNDKINGRGGSDLICGRRGDDDLIGGWGNDRVSAARGRTTYGVAPGATRFAEAPTSTYAGGAHQSNVSL